MSKEAAKSAYEKMRRAAEAQRALLDSIKGREASAEERAQLATIDAEIDGHEAEARHQLDEADREERGNALEARFAKFSGVEAPSDEDAEQAFAEQIRGLASGSVREARASLPVGVEMPRGLSEVRTATSGTAANAGNTKRLTFVAQVVEAMRWRSQFFSLCRTITTQGGEQLTFPVRTAHPTAAQVAENATYATSDTTWSTATLSAYKYGVIIQATREIVADSALDILSLLAEDAGIAVADAVMADLVVGSGTGKPKGYVTASTGTVNAANLAGITFDNVIDLEHSLLVPYRRSALFMCHDTTVAALRKLKDSQGRYLWEPSLQVGAPSTLHGIPVLTDPNILTAGAGAKVLVYGDPRNYTLRQANDISVVRSDEYGFAQDVVSFKVTWRGDGNLLDTAAVKALTVTA